METYQFMERLTKEYATYEEDSDNQFDDSVSEERILEDFGNYLANKYLQD